MLAQAIIEEQVAEIIIMQDLIAQLYPKSTYVVSYESMMTSPSTDRLFLQEMIMHHKMAIMMAEQVLELTDIVDVVMLAQNIIDSQSEEIELIEELLAHLE